MPALGVDFGTSRIRAAVVTDDTPQVIQFGDGSHAMPAAVAIEKGAARVGRAAIARAAMNPQNAVLGVKRYLGRSATDPIVERLARQCGLSLSGEGEAFGFRIGDRLWQPEHVAAELFKKVWETACQATAIPPEGALITAPYWFGPRQRQALKSAASSAGVDVLQVMSEGTAIALSLAATDLEQRRAAIVDLGAGGCTASILELGPQRVALLATSGSREGGGDDIDHDIVRAMLKGLKAKYGDFDVFPAITEIIRQACEGMKRDLLAVETAQATIPFLPIGTGVSMQQITLERRHFHAMMGNAVERVKAACREAMVAAKLEPSDLDAVYVTGGLSQVPIIREAIVEVLGQVTSRQLDVDGGAAIGAALQSAMMEGRVEPIPTVDIVTTASIPPPPPNDRMTIPPADVRSIAPTRRTTPPPRASSRAPVSDTHTHPPRGDVDIAYRDAIAEVPVESMRMELATLLASVRGGALTETAHARKSNVARKSRDVDEDDAPAEARDEIAERLAQCWGQLHRAMQAVRQYAWDHPHTAGYFERVHTLILEGLQAWPQSMRCDVGTTSLAYDRRVVWKPERPPFDTVPYQLFVDGLRTLQFKPGFEKWELRELMAVLLRDAGGVLVSDDDAVSALWDRSLPHVGYVAVDAYLDVDDPEFEQDLNELEKQLGDLCSFGDSDGMSARLEGQRTMADEAIALTLSETVRAELTRGIELEEDAWLGRYIQLFPRALAEAELVGDAEALFQGLSTFAGDAISSSQSDVVFDVWRRLVEAVREEAGDERAGAFEHTASATMFTAERLLRVVQDLARIGLDERVVGDLTRVLKALPDDRFFEAASGVFWDVPEVLQPAVLEYQLRFAAGRENALQEVLVRAEPSLAITTLHGLSRVGTDAARLALLRAFDSPHLEVKVSAIAFLPDAAAERVRSEVARLLEDPSDQVRLRTLGVLSSLGSTSVGPVLVRRIQTVDLSSLTAREQRLLLETLVKLSPRRGSEIAIEVLNTTQMIPTRGPEQTRAIAAEVLGEVVDDAVSHALEQAMRKKWSNTAPVREAAQRSLEMLQQRKRTGSNREAQ